MNMEIMECTLRDGSYAVNFKFDEKFTAKFCKEIDSLNFAYIEVGHGMGIGASKKIVEASASDFQYANAAQKSISKSKWGMFAIPGIATTNEIKQLQEMGMSFVRIGVDATKFEEGLDFINKIVDLDLEIYVNFMKSYALKIEELISMINACVIIGKIKGVYLVDSAGGMLPNEIEKYGSEFLKFKNQTKIGFHGHDNLGLSISNSFLLAEAGFDIIDTTMQGIGRSSGNASTERFVALASKTGILQDMDLISILKFGENLIRPIIPYPGHGGLDTMAGFMLFHTSYMENLIKVSKKLNLDPYVLMQEHCSKNLITAGIEELETLGNTLLLNFGSYKIDSLPKDIYVGNEQ